MEEKIRGLEKEKEELEEEKGLLEKEKKELKEERGGIERNRLLTQNQEYQRSSQDHTPQIELLNAQLKQYECDFQKERDQRERLVVAYDMVEKRLSDVKNSLQQEINSYVSHCEVSDWLIYSIVYVDLVSGSFV